MGKMQNNNECKKQIHFYRFSIEGFHNRIKQILQVIILPTAMLVSFSTVWYWKHYKISQNSGLQIQQESIPMMIRLTSTYENQLPPLNPIVIIMVAIKFDSCKL